ncbi:hypothetical protein [Maribacter antarcticus]|uniref:hypothetical protein n=1 Tax=Maribacter antarcticus TaxID=505250 RepID=UPI00047DA32A|nr:hypothetical protein [Maribacter antarcticus]
MKTFKLLVFVFLIVSQTTSLAQEWKTDRKINVLFGLTQPLLVDGFNIEGNYIHNRLIFDYSHGVSLDFSGSSTTTELEMQGVTVHMPWTTGFGVGYRLNEWLNIRVEPNWHRFEFYYEGESQTSLNEIDSYNTFSLGLGLYGNFQPFKNSTSFIKGIMVTPSIRFWPTVSSSLDGDSFTYNNKNTGAMETIEVLDSDVAFTPFIFNVSIGYSFDLKKKK